MTTIKSLATKKFDLFEIAGSAYARGHQYGVHYEHLLKRLITTNFDYHARVLGRSKDKVIERARRYRKYTEDFSPTVKEELRGISKGSNVELDHIYMLASFCELIYPNAKNGAVAGSANALTFMQRK